MTAGRARSLRRIALFTTSVLAAATFVFAAPTAVTAVEAPPLTQVVVPLDPESAFALDPANSRPVGLGDGPTGSVRLAIPSTLDSATIDGTVQVFRTGTGSVADRWVGEIAGSVFMTNSPTPGFTFRLPVGEYVLFVEGFAAEGSTAGIWSWAGGGFDATAAEAVTVIEDEETSVLLPSFRAVQARVQVSDTFAYRDAEVGVCMPRSSDGVASSSCASQPRKLAPSQVSVPSFR